MTTELVAIKRKLIEAWKEERLRKLIILVAGLAVAAVYGSIFIVPKVVELPKVSREINDLNRKIDLVGDRVRRLDSMKQKLNDLKGEMEGYAKGLPKEKEIPEFLEELSSIAKVSGIKILSITPSALSGAQGGGHYKEMPINISAKCGYHQLGQFISEIELSKRFITVGDLQIRQDENTPSKHLVNIVLIAYVAVDEK